MSFTPWVKPTHEFQVFTPWGKYTFWLNPWGIKAK